MPRPVIKSAPAKRLATVRSTVSPTFVNRELSLLQFNERVLAMAEDQATPLLERLRYICIVGSNLDEFFEIRVSSLKEQDRLHPTMRGPDGLTAAQALTQVQRQVHGLVKRLYAFTQ
jgi:polyphosphate kinase